MKTLCVTPVKNHSIVVEQIVMLAISLFISVVYDMNFCSPEITKLSIQSSHSFHHKNQNKAL